MRVVVVGGGPGGLMTARLIEQKTSGETEVVLLEASGRIGGKLHTQPFSRRPVRYESGIAECYDYEAFGPDPLKQLVRTLGLTPVPTHGHTVVVDGVAVRHAADLGRAFGAAAQADVDAFHQRATATWMPRHWAQPAATRPSHPWAQQSWAASIDRVRDPAAHRYLRTLMHSDLASEPHLVDGETGLRNYLKSVDGYGAQYTIAGGMGRLAQRLAASLTRTTIHLHAPVERISGCDADGYHVAGPQHDFSCDAVVVALPYPCLRTIRWGSPRLQRAIDIHWSAFDHPAHYVRVALLFERPFWRPAWPATDSWMMLDAFGGCCLYDETPADQGESAPGVLNCLLAGADALALSNLADDELVARVLAALPRAWTADGMIESRVHRWVGSLSARPGGVPRRDVTLRHCPEPVAHSQLVMVGDHLLDATLNGVLQSAEMASDRIQSACGQSAGRTWQAGDPARAAAPLSRSQSARLPRSLQGAQP